MKRIMVKPRVLLSIVLMNGLLFVSGCARPPEPEFALSDRVLKLKDEKSRTEVGQILELVCGTPSAIKMLGSEVETTPKLKLGARVYAKNCRQCHGVSGDGNGPAALHLIPRPRDYRPGIFKFTSTVYGSKPLREDLARTIKRGIAGTSMPSFRLMPQAEMEAVVDYVLALTHRGELELLLAQSFEDEETVDFTLVKEHTDGIIERWTAARAQVVNPLSPMPVFTMKSIEAGRAVFLEKNCKQCHGEDGRGESSDAQKYNDSWGNPTKPADLTAGMLRGGTEPLDVYRHIYAGINGTPMPAFSTMFQGEPETMWNLTAFVLDLSNRRRQGVIPQAGSLNPLPGVVLDTAPAAARPAAALNESAKSGAILSASRSEPGTE